MKRRWLPAIPTSKAWTGAYASKWDGWEKAWQRNVAKGELWKWYPKSISMLKKEDLRSMSLITVVFMFFLIEMTVFFMLEGLQH